MEATPLTAEQKAVLSTAFHYIQSIAIYLKLKAVIQVVRETDAMLLELWAANGSSLLELGDVCLRRLPLFFPELRCSPKNTRSVIVLTWEDAAYGPRGVPEDYVERCQEALDDYENR